MVIVNLKIKFVLKFVETVNPTNLLLEIVKMRLETIL